MDSASSESSAEVSSPSAQQAAQELANTLPSNRVSLHGDKAFKEEMKSYWSKLPRDLKPTCIVFPEATEEVAKAVAILSRYPEVQFAVKSGGHDPNPGNASVHGGVLISFARMVGATYVKEESCALVRPGGVWNRVISDLESHGVTIVGGRLGSVGVGGYLVQGGLSFLSAQYGLAADNIIGWETVRPDGSVVHVDAATDPDLAKAMRGSGNQFGIVTQFKIKTHPIGKVWGGLRVYTGSQSLALYPLLHKFIPVPDKDPRAALIFTEVHTLGATLTMVHYCYDAPNPPSTGPYAELLKLPAMTNLCKTMKYSEMLKYNGWGPQLISGRIAFRSFTMPYVPNNPELYHEIRAKWKELCSRHLRFDKFLHAATSVLSVVFQPFPSIIGQRSEAAGGNAMGLTGSDPDRIIIELQTLHSNPADDELIRGIARDMTAWLETKLPGWLQEARTSDQDGASQVYMPFFMNDAESDQEVTSSYREREKLKALQAEVDPEGIYRRRLGGHKY